MYKLISLLSLLVFTTYLAIAQTQPAEGSVLHYRAIPFSIPKEQQSTGTQLQIATGNLTSPADFEKNIIQTIPCKISKIIATVPAWGSRYTWRMVNKTNKAIPQLHHFSTLAIPKLDSTSTHVRIIKNSGAYKEAYLFIDAARTLYNIQGEPIWYLPDVEGMINEHSQVRDIKLSPAGTITFLIGETIFEMDYSGKVLWHLPLTKKAPGVVQNHFHHEFTRLKNSHYMALGNEMVSFKLPDPDDNTLSVTTKDKMDADTKRLKYGGAQFGTIIEYDAAHKEVWSWSASQHFDLQGLFYRKTPATLTNLDLHLNAFFFDEAKNRLFCSFKNISQVLEINHTTGEVVHTYGKAFGFNTPSVGDSFFCNQHSCKLSANGKYLYVFNNNTCEEDKLPSIVMMKLPTNENALLEKVREMECPVEELQKQEMKKFDKSHFGNVLELPGGDIFASCSSPFGNVFIANKDKEILWNAVSERWNETEKKWVPIPTYRASIITSSSEFEKLAWGTKN